MAKCVRYSPLQTMSIRGEQALDYSVFLPSFRGTFVNHLLNAMMYLSARLGISAIEHEFDDVMHLSHADNEIGDNIEAILSA